MHKAPGEAVEYCYTCDECSVYMGRYLGFKKRRITACDKYKMSDYAVAWQSYNQECPYFMGNTMWQPTSERENEIARLCQDFCNKCPQEVVEKHGKRSQDNKPFEYFMYWDILSTPQDDPYYLQNRAKFDEYKAYILEHETELREALREVEVANA